MRDGERHHQQSSTQNENENKIISYIKTGNLF